MFRLVAPPTTTKKTSTMIMLNLFGPPNVFIYLMLDFLKKDEFCKCSRVNVKTIHACQHFKDNFRKSPLHTVDTYF